MTGADFGVGMYCMERSALYAPIKVKQPLCVSISAFGGRCAFPWRRFESYGHPTTFPDRAKRGTLTVFRYCNCGGLRPVGSHESRSVRPRGEPGRGRGRVLTAARVLSPVLLFVLLGRCGFVADDGVEAPTTGAPSSTSVRPATTGTAVPGTTTSQTGRLTGEEQQVVDAYLAAMAAFDQTTADPPNPDHPALAATTVDPALTEVRDLAASWKGFGQALRYPTTSVHEITTLSVEIDGATATIETCNVDDGILYEPASGRVLNDKITTAHDRATMTLVAGTWKLATRAQVQKWEGVAGCAVASS